MKTITVLIVLIVIYFIYQISCLFMSIDIDWSFLSPKEKFTKVANLIASIKFNRAVKLMSKEKFPEARKIFMSLINKHPEAVTKFVECYFLQEDLIRRFDFLNKIIESRSLLTRISNRYSFELIEEKAYYEIASIMYNQIGDYHDLSTIKDLQSNLVYIRKATKREKTNDFKELGTKHNHLIAEIYYSIGIKCEKQYDFSEAIVNYANAVSSLKEVDKNKIYYNALIRKQIATLKNGSTIDVNVLSEIKSIKHRFKTDLYFRYFIRLIKSGTFDKAEEILNTELKIKNEQSNLLRNIVHNEKLKRAISELKEINSQVEKLNSEGLSNKEAESLFESLNMPSKLINDIIPEAATQLFDIKPGLINRLLTFLLNNDQNERVINQIIKIPRFYEFPVLMKYLGNACLNYVENGMLVEDNYKESIAMFLTSVYSDEVMLYSIENTSWCDDFTFTLVDAIGSAYHFHDDLPENINYNQVSGTNISIGDAQRELVRYFEAQLNEKISNPQLFEEVHSFYNSEKAAIEKIISIIPDKITFTTPYFAYKFETYKNILTELENDYQKFNNEESLEVASLYNINNSDENIQYFQAKVILQDILTAISTGNLARLNEVSTVQNIDLINCYKTISEKVEDEIISVFQSIIDRDGENDYLIPVFKRAIEITPTKDKLNYQYANFVASLCMTKVNDNSMGNFKALQLISDAYMALPEDTMICENIIKLIRLNIMDIINDRVYAVSPIFTLIDRNNRKYALAPIFALIDNIKKNRSVTFNQHAKELAITRQSILSEYSSDQREELLFGRYLTQNETKIKKGLDYLDELSGFSFKDDSLNLRLKNLGLDYNP